MFASIAGLYPRLDEGDELDLGEVLADQLEAGLGVVADGRLHALLQDEDIDAVVVAWARADAAVTGLLRSAGITDPEAGRPAETSADPGAGRPAETSADRPLVKACLLGPLSMTVAAGEALAPRSSADPAGSAAPALSAGRAAAVARVREAIRSLHAAGAPIVQVDEPWTLHAGAATAVGRAAATAAWSEMLDGVEGHVTLALPGGGATNVGADAMVAAPFSSYLVDLIHGPDDWREVGHLPGERGVILGVADLRPGRRDTREVLVWAARHAAAMHGRGLQRVGLTTSAGLESLPREAARERLARLAEVAGLAALQGADLASRLDPRSIDARSAALGRWEPRPPMAAHPPVTHPDPESARLDSAGAGADPTPEPSADPAPDPTADPAAR